VPISIGTSVDLHAEWVSIWVGIRIKKGQSGVSRDSDLLLGQVIAVANESFRQEIGSLPNPMMEEVENRIRIILSL
jgi:mRNA-degrading endonuclease toxin of MazEF toxin-antitoxin module